MPRPTDMSSTDFLSPRWMMNHNVMTNYLRSEQARRSKEESNALRKRMERDSSSSESEDETPMSPALRARMEAFDKEWDELDKSIHDSFKIFDFSAITKLFSCLFGKKP